MPQRITYWILGTVLAIGLMVRIINLNYNSAFNDEAIYAVVGRLGLFQGDWWTYNAAAWMAGQPYIYPPMTAIAYQSGGIVGSRLLNVIFGLMTIEVVFELTKLIARKEGEKKANLAGIIAAIIAATTTTGLYVSRLATYDLPSFYLLLLSLLYLYRTKLAGANLGRLYFFAFLFLMIAFATKIVIGLYLPLLVLWSGWEAYRDKHRFGFWCKYFLVPLMMMMVFYTWFNFGNVMAYGVSQMERTKNSYEEIFLKYWDNSRWVWILWAAGSFALFLKNKWWLWLGYSSLAVIVVIFHFVTKREPTLDKHTYLSILFLVPLIGIGLSGYITQFTNRFYQTGAAIITALALIIFGMVSYRENYRFNFLWKDSTKVLEYLKKNVRPGDKVLAEVGAAAILATYDKNFPTYTVTFDWFQYGELEGNGAYVKAINDGYFDWVELDANSRTKKDFHSDKHNTVLANLEGNYIPVYSYDGYLVYKRAF